MRKSAITAPLRRPLFRRLATTYAINEMGDWMGIVALSVLVYEATGSALATTVLFLGTRFLPAFLAPLLVTRIERPPPRLALPLVYCGETAAFGALALLTPHFSLAVVVALATIDGTLALAGRALTRAVVASVLEPAGELREGNAVLNVAFTAGAALGPGLAGLVVAGLGVQTALFLNAASFYVVAWILITAGNLPRAEPEEGGTVARARAGARYLRDNKILRRLLVAQGSAFVFFSAVIPVEVIYAKETLDTSDTGYGVMLASWGVGMLLGSLVFARARRAPLIALLMLSTLAVGVGYLGLAIAPNLAFACIASVIGGTGNGVQWVSAISAVQELTEAGMQARVMAVLESIGAAMPGVGFALGGLIAAIATPRTTFLVAGLGVLAIVALIGPTLGGKGGGRLASAQGIPLDETNDVVLELLPGGMPTPNSSEVEF
ncbi:MAG TPA: MFS transporter [Solirubrobacterales bacterium]|nr:MFS transporter [Solirubrobacterales bacterium]